MGTSSVAQQAPDLLRVNTTECISPFEHALKMYLEASERNTEMVCLSLRRVETVYLGLLWSCTRVQGFARSLGSVYL